MSTRVDLRSMIHNDIINKLLNPPHHATQKTKEPGSIGNEVSDFKHFLPITPREHKHVLRSLREYKLITHSLGIALIITLLATSALWVWAIALYEQLTFLGGV